MESGDVIEPIPPIVVKQITTTYNYSTQINMSTEEEKPSKVYDAGCHCGKISFSFKLSPPLEEGHKVLSCNCSICRRAGYLLVCTSLFKRDLG